MSNNHVQQNENEIDENQNEQMKHEYSSKSRGRFTSEEGQLLLDLYARYGKKWKEISSHFVNRTSTLLKTHLEALHRKSKPNMIQSSLEKSGQCYSCRFLSFCFLKKCKNQE